MSENDEAITNLLRWNEEKAERIASLEQQLADSDLAFNHADECVGKYMADTDALRAEVARLSAPMSEEEMSAFPWLSKKVAAARFDLIIGARRANPPTSVVKNKTTEQDRDFLDHIEAIAEQMKDTEDWKKGSPVNERTPPAQKEPSCS